jgi:hypothetical protein
MIERFFPSVDSAYYALLLDLVIKTHNTLLTAEDRANARKYNLTDLQMLNMRKYRALLNDTTLQAVFTDTDGGVNFARMCMVFGLCAETNTDQKDYNCYGYVHDHLKEIIYTDDEK